MKTLNFIVTSIVLATLLIATNVTVFAQNYEYQKLFSRPGVDGDPDNPLEEVWDYVQIEKSRETPTVPYVDPPFVYRTTIERNGQNMTCNSMVIVSQTLAYVACPSYIIKLAADAQGVWRETTSWWAGLGAPYNFYGIAKGGYNKIYVAGGLTQGNGQNVGILYSKSVNDADTWENVGNYYDKMFTTVGSPSRNTLYDDGVVAVGPNQVIDINNSPEGLLKYPSPRASMWRPFNVEGVTGRSYGNQISAVRSGSGFQYTMAGSRFCRSSNGVDWSCASPANGAEAFISGVDMGDDTYGGIVGQVGTTGWFRATSDGGSTWSARKFTANMPFNSVTFSETNNNRAWIAAGNISGGVSSGGVFFSVNYGDTWSLSTGIPSNTKMVSCSNYRVPNTSRDFVACVGHRMDQGKVVTDIYTTVY